MKKRRGTSFVVFFLVLISLMSLLTGCSTSEKIPIPTVKSNIYIYDENNIIDDDVEKELNKMLVELKEKTESEFAIISVDSLLNRSIEEYSNNLFNTLGIGKKGSDNGVLLLISRPDTRVRLEIGRGLEGCLNDAKCGRILDDYFVPYRESDEYTKATELTVKAVIAVIAEEYDITISGLDLKSFEVDESNESAQADELTPEQTFLSIIILLVILFVVEWITGHLFGDGFGDGLVTIILSSSSGSSRSSGGGFGGGFSGGGGASR